ncbi:lambda exonuclease family protein [Brachybacterium sp. FME24]|uniref:lambda exonuclease family protein n=1 Tax=Brachybacterium sp. FME24 TaxID=2742605 RepID=UPI00186771F3|nr:lambda exonuclease family protein [Brachybacterium sp. FME24]
MTLTIFPELEQGSSEWIQARAGIVTASTVGKLLTSTGKVANNDTSRTLIETLALERITGRVETMRPTFDMARGTALEPSAREVYAERRAPVTEVGFGRIDQDGYSFGGSPDGLVDELGGLEIKCPKPLTHFRTTLDQNVPRIYLPQIHGNMLVFDADWWDFMSYAPGMSPFVKRVHRDTEWDDAITEAAHLAEDAIRALIQAYGDTTAGNHPTEHFDPFDTEEVITFG